MSTPVDSPPLALEEEPSEPSDTLDLRIASIFIIFVAAAVGGLVPVVFRRFRNPSDPITLIVRALAAGVILSLALVHVSGPRLRLGRSNVALTPLTNSMI